MPVKVKAIQKRKSVRSFSSIAVSDDDIMDIIEAGCMAPSPKNLQPWRVHIVRQPELGALSKRFIEMLDKKSDTKEIIEGCYTTVDIMSTASVALFVFNSENDDRYECSLNQSIGAFIENMCLESTERDIDSLWCCDILQISDEIRDLFNIDGKLMACLLLGHHLNDSHRVEHKHAHDILV